MSPVELAQKIQRHMAHRRQIRHSLALAVALSQPCMSAVERRRRNTNALPAALPVPRLPADDYDYLIQRADAP